MLEKLRSLPAKIGVFASVCFACAFCGFPAVASFSTAGLISFVYAISSGSTQVVFFNQSGARSAPPSCATYSPARWVVDVSTPGGQAAMSIIMTAAANGHEVIVNGSDNCSLWGDTETVLNVVYL
jgi:hypothetical protein